jgi:hypothetical protein
MSVEYLFIGVGVVGGLLSVLNAVVARRSMLDRPRTVVEVRQPDGHAVTMSARGHVDMTELIDVLRTARPPERRAPP